MNFHNEESDMSIKLKHYFLKIRYKVTLLGSQNKPYIYTAVYYNVYMYFQITGCIQYLYPRSPRPSETSQTFNYL